MIFLYFQDEAETAGTCHQTRTHLYGKDEVDANLMQLAESAAIMFQGSQFDLGSFTFVFSFFSVCFQFLFSFFSLHVCCEYSE